MHAGGLLRKQSMSPNDAAASAITEVAGLGAAGDGPGHPCLHAAAAAGMPLGSLQGQGLINHPTGSPAAAAATSQSQVGQKITHAAEYDGQASANHSSVVHDYTHFASMIDYSAYTSPVKFAEGRGATASPGSKPPHSWKCPR